MSGSAASAAGIAGTRGGSCRSGLSSPAIDAKRRHAEEPRAFVDVLVVDLDFLDQRLAHPVRNSGRDLQPDDRAELAPPDFPVDDGKQVVRLLFANFHVHVPGHPERVAADDVHARKEVVQVRGDQVLQRQKILHGRVPRLAADLFQGVEGNEAGKALGDLDARELALSRLGIPGLDREREREVREKRKGMPRIDGQRRQHRKDGLPEIRARTAFDVPVEGLPIVDPDSVLIEQRKQISGQRFGRAGELLAHDLADPRELLARRQPVRTSLADPGLELLVEARDPDHEELVEVAIEDREEFHPLEKGPARVERFVQNALVESEPRNLAVEIQGRIFDVDRNGRGCRVAAGGFFFFRHGTFFLHPGC